MSTVERQIAMLGGEDWLTEDDVSRFNVEKAAILRLLSDGRPHHRSEIERAGRGKESIRRLRELRGFFEIRCERLGGADPSGWYTLVGPKQIDDSPQPVRHCKTCRCFDGNSQ